MAAVFVEDEDVPVGEPGQVSASLSRLRCEALIDMTKPCSICSRITSLDAADVVDIGDYPLADLRRERTDESGVAGRNLEQLAGAFALVGKHATAEQAELNALVSAACRNRKLVLGFELLAPAWQPRFEPI